MAALPRSSPLAKLARPAAATGFAAGRWAGSRIAILVRLQPGLHWRIFANAALLHGCPLRARSGVIIIQGSHTYHGHPASGDRRGMTARSLVTGT